MTTKELAKNCDECKHLKTNTIDLSDFPYCLKGHKPRLYKPQNLSDAHSGNWGFKRRCEDFKEATNDNKTTSRAIRCKSKNHPRHTLLTRSL